MGEEGWNEWAPIDLTISVIGASHQRKNRKLFIRTPVFQLLLKYSDSDAIELAHTDISLLTP